MGWIVEWTPSPLPLDQGRSGTASGDEGIEVTQPSGPGTIVKTNTKPLPRTISAFGGEKNVQR